jgi:hypothetical protein
MALQSSTIFLRRALLPALAALMLLPPSAAPS